MSKTSTAAAVALHAARIARAAASDHGFASGRTLGPRQTSILAFVASQRDGKARLIDIAAFDTSVNYKRVRNCVNSLVEHGLLYFTGSATDFVTVATTAKARELMLSGRENIVLSL